MKLSLTFFLKETTVAISRMDEVQNRKRHWMQNRLTHNQFDSICFIMCFGILTPPNDIVITLKRLSLPVQRIAVSTFLAEEHPENIKKQHARITRGFLCHFSG